MSRYFVKWLTLVFIILFVLRTFGETQLQTPSAFFPQPAWSPDGSKVAVAADYEIYVFDTGTGHTVQTLRGHRAYITSISWSPNSTQIASASGDLTVRVWNVPNGVLLTTINSFEFTPIAIWTPDGQSLITNEIEGPTNLKIWTADRTELIASHYTGTMVDMAFNFDGTFLGMVSPGVLHVVDSQFTSRRSSPVILCCTNQTYVLAWSNDGDEIVTGSTDGIVTIWDALEVQKVHEINVASSLSITSSMPTNLVDTWIRDVSYSADGTAILSVSGNGSVGQWNSDTGELIHGTSVYPLSAAAWSPYGGQLATVDISALQPGSARNTGTGLIDIHVPFASLEQLNMLSETCVSSSARTLPPAADLDSLPEFVAQVEALPEDAIPPACRADLLAVAEAIMARR